MSAAYPKAVRQFGFAAMASRAERVRQAPARPKASGVRTSGPPRRTVVRLWLPLTPVLLLLSPIPLLLAPLAYLAPAAYRPRNPYAAVFAIGRLLICMGGTLVHVDTPDALVSIRIF